MKTITRPSIPLDEATDRALEVIDLLAPYATRITIGGSIRRGKASVGDMEIICQSDVQDLPVGRKGFIKVPKTPAISWICERLNEEGVFDKRLNINGKPIAWAKERYKAAVYKGIALDIFIVTPPRQWGVIHLIRTGPGDANEVLVTQQGRRTTQGDTGILPAHLKFEDGQLWQNGTVLETPEESDVFKALLFPYIPPPNRDVYRYQRAARLADQQPDMPRTFPADLNDIWRADQRFVVLTNPAGFIHQHFYKE